MRAMSSLRSIPAKRRLNCIAAAQEMFAQAARSRGLAFILIVIEAR